MFQTRQKGTAWDEQTDTVFYRRFNLDYFGSSLPLCWLEKMGNYCLTKGTVFNSAYSLFQWCSTRGEVLLWHIENLKFKFHLFPNNLVHFYLGSRWSSPSRLQYVCFIKFWEIIFNASSNWNLSTWRYLGQGSFLSFRAVLRLCNFRLKKPK